MGELQFKRAVKTDARLRLALDGPPGSGKTWTALKVGTELGGPIALVDTEHGSASKYADIFEFDVLELSSFNPQNYIDAISAAEKAGYKVCILDSLSHAWAGQEGALELHDKAVAKQKTKNSYVAWRDVTPLHNKLVDAMIASDMHIIATMRTKMAHVQEQDASGKTVIRKVGMAPIQREGMEYEFDVVGDLDHEHKLVVSKTRCPELNEEVFTKPGKEFAEILKGWLVGVPVERSAKPPLRAVPPSQSKARSQDKPGKPASGNPRPLEAKIVGQFEALGKRGEKRDGLLADVRAFATSELWEVKTLNSLADCTGEQLEQYSKYLDWLLSNTSGAESEAPVPNPDDEHIQGGLRRSQCEEIGRLWAQGLNDKKFKEQEECRKHLQEFKPTANGRGDLTEAEAETYIPRLREFVTGTPF